MIKCINLLINLRGFIFNIEYDDESTYLHESLNYDVLKDVSGVVIGGHNKWQSRMKEHLPNCKFILPEMLNTLDLTIFSKVNIVFIYTNYLNHALYYKVIDTIKNKDITLRYLKPHKNIELVLKQVIEIVDTN